MQRFNDQANNENKGTLEEQDVPRYGQEKMVNSSPLLRISGDATKDLLHRSIVAIRYEDPLINNRFFIGTGTLLSNDLILTSAQNLVDKRQCIQFQKQFFRIFEATQDGFVQKFHKIKDWRYMGEFLTCKNDQKLYYDYALIKLEPNPMHPITYNQFLELRPPCKCVLKKDPNIKLEIYGYASSYKDIYEPVDIKFARLFQYGLTISGGILEVDPQDFKITYAVNTLEGQIGCPGVVGNQIISIHNGTAGKELGEWSIGRLITPDLVQNIGEWAKQLGGIPYSVKHQIFCPHQQQDTSFIPEISKKEEQQVQEATKILSQISPDIAEAQKLEESAERHKDKQRYGLALEQYKKSMAIYEQINGKDSIEAAAIFVYGIGDVYQLQGKQELALEAFERGKVIYLEKEGEESYGYAVSLDRIGNVYKGREECDSALGYYKKALTIYQKTQGKDSIEAGKVIEQIGLIYSDKGEYTQALQYLKRSLQIEESSGEGNSIEAAQTHDNIGSVYNAQKQYSLALQHYQKALSIKQSIQGKDSVEAASTMMNIGVVYSKQGDYPRAVQIYKQVIVIYEEQQLKQREYADAYYNLGIALYSMNDYGTAGTAYIIALPIYEQMDLTDQIKNCSLGLAQCQKAFAGKLILERINKKQEVQSSEI